MVGLEVGWELKEEQPEAAGFVGGRESLDELGDIGFRVAESFEVSDALGGLEAETEVRRRGAKPAFEHLDGGQRAEGVVDFDGVELGGVVLEELFCGNGGWVEAGLPRGIDPTGGSCEETVRRCEGCRRRRCLRFRFARHEKFYPGRVRVKPKNLLEDFGAASGFRTHDIRCHRAAFCH